MLFSESSAGKEKADFLAEIDMMKKIAEGYNTHIVNMVGCVTLQEPLCLITEFVPYGDLLSYLKYQRKKVCTYVDYLRWIKLSQLVTALRTEEIPIFKSRILQTLLHFFTWVIKRGFTENTTSLY